MAGSRRRARILALQTLYEVDTASHPAADVLKRHLEEEGAQHETGMFARQLVEGTLRELNQIDEVIRECAPAWPLEQMAKLDKNILRLAIFEILFDNSATPPKVVINEAVELAKLFGGEASSKFVNGVLGSVVARRA
ncbi:MAG: transcription antitermination factor NusB [Chloroflexi bacterium]|nr:transcription antitermination factor NusB [Chloroflexota bacterium]